MAAALEGGLVVYLGAGAEPPRDITAWMSDRDLSNPDLRARVHANAISALQSVLSHGTRHARRLQCDWSGGKILQG